MARSSLFAGLIVCLGAATALADVGDPQIRTDHPWYPGELACSSFERLFATQAAVYERVTGNRPVTDEQKALAAWLWRNTHYWHGEEGAEDIWGQGLNKGPDRKAHEYWTGLFAHGFALCGTTHGQWCAEMEELLGHNRGRVVGTDGHNSFEVFLKGGPYGDGKWVLLDHDVSTVIYDAEATRLLSIREVAPDWKKWTDRGHLPGKQHGWLVCGLHPSDGGVYAAFNAAEYFAGYSGPPPMVHLRRGEALRRFPEPGLENGNTYVYWGRNYKSGGVPGPERPQTWVNQPEKMYKSKNGTGSNRGQARFANAVYTYRPNFTNGDYREGVVDEDSQHVTFEFYTPYIIAATPANDAPFGIYDPGATNGLIVGGKANCTVSISVDQGTTWIEAGKLVDGLDLTDHVKGCRQYLIRFNAGTKDLADAGLSIRTVCQANASVIPHLKEDGSEIRLAVSRRAVISAGPNVPQAAAHLIEGQFGGPAVTLALNTPRGEPVREVYAAAQVASGNPPRTEVKYQIDVSTDGGKTWKRAVKDWSILKQGDQPKDFWSQSLVWGKLRLEKETADKVQVRFTNNGNRAILRAEAHLVYETREPDATKVTVAWKDDRGGHEASRVLTDGGQWTVPTGKKVQTLWIEMTPDVKK